VKTRNLRTLLLEAYDNNPGTNINTS